uniref:Integrase core domain containing protein n=1 Tax=Solanum tuberosum TaxID=4113 RepID=M1DZL3_SOLTU
MLGALYNEDVPQSESTRVRGKRHRSSHTSEATEDAREKKREHKQNEYARRASIVDEKLRQQKVRESIADASSFVPILEAVATVRYDVSTNDGTVRVIDITTEGAVIDDVGTTEGDPSVVPARSRTPDPPAC